MPKAPINSRTVYYTIRRDGTIRFTDWNLVDTNLGAMVEPAMCNEVVQPIIDMDLDEISFNRMELLDEVLQASVLGTAGNQVCVNYNSQ